MRVAKAFYSSLGMRKEPVTVRLTGVIEHYVDPSYRFSGLLSFALHLIQKKRPNTRTDH